MLFQIQYTILNIIKRSKFMTYLKQLYYLIDEYQKGRYNLKDFCDLFTDIFNFSS